ncbi:MAG: Efflux transporter periplasmic adaptor subunit [Verrucomicrobia bacterium]|nr:Efflux transporter periplasmic adaptor subunit [Verrucomicrobiota bacterium]
MKSRARFFFHRAGMFGALSVSLGVLAGCAEKTKGPGRAAPPAPVFVGKAERRVVPLTLDAIGAVEPIQTSALRAQVTGMLQRILFQEGQDVKEGTPLFEIDPRSFKQALTQAEADVERARVQAGTAEAEVKRYASLHEGGAISSEQFQSIEDNARALRAAYASAQAVLETDRLRLEFCSIKAPIAGRTGTVNVHEGDLVRASDPNVVLVVINQLSPINVTFSVPQRYLAALKQYSAAGTVPVAATPPGASDVVEQGSLTFIDNAIDAATGTLKLKAAFTNSEHRLWPGQFTHVRLTLDSPQVLVVPATAVQNDQKGQHVLVVHDDSTAELRSVTVERSTETDAVISSGVKEGETVITEGQLRVLPGSSVEVRQRDASAAAAPSENNPPRRKK